MSTERWLEHLELRNFRNYAAEELTLTAGVNLVVGENAQGKTNLLEAVHWLLTGRSPRTRVPAELVRFGAGSLRVTGSFRRGEETWRRERRYPPSGPRTEEEAVIYFAPEDLALVRGAPAHRRHFLQTDLTQAFPVQRRQLVQLQRILGERQAWLKRALSPEGRLWDALDEQLARSAAPIFAFRIEVMTEVSRLAEEIWGSVRPGENLAVSYRPGAAGVGVEEILRSLRERRSEEWRRRLPLVGPQRDDILITVGGRELRRFGSQGQVRTAAVALKLAALRYLTRVLGESPLLLLDDVLSELDSERRRLVLEQAAGQVLVTAADPGEIPPGYAGYRLIRIAGGRLQEVSP